MDRLISLSRKTERDQYTVWKHKHKSDASRDRVGRYSKWPHDISICIYTCTEVLCWPFTCSYFRSTSKAFGWYGGWGIWGGGGFLRGARCGRTSCTAPRTALIINIFLNHSLNQFIQKQWFIQEWNTTALLLWNMHGCEDTWRGHSHLTVVHNLCSTGTKSCNTDCYRISSSHEYTEHTAPPLQPHLHLIQT